MTTSLELSKRLWEKGLKLDTEKWWNGYYVHGSDILQWRVINKNDFGNAETYPAYSVDELLKVLPKVFTNDYVFHPKQIGLLVEYLLDNGWVYDSEKKGLVKN